MKNKPVIKSRKYSLQEVGFEDIHRIAGGRLSIDWGLENWKELGLEFNFNQLYLCEIIKSYKIDDNQKIQLIFPSFLAIGLPNKYSQKGDFIQFYIRPNMESLDQELNFQNLEAKLKIQRNKLNFFAKGLIKETHHYPFFFEKPETNLPEYSKEGFFMTRYSHSKNEVPINNMYEK